MVLQYDSEVFAFTTQKELNASTKYLLLPVQANRKTHAEQLLSVFK